MNKYQKEIHKIVQINRFSLLRNEDVFVTYRKYKKDLKKVIKKHKNVNIKILRLVKESFKESKQKPEIKE